MVRMGIPACFPRFTAVAAEIGAPILISANAMRHRHRRHEFRIIPPDLFNGCDTALDSAGFVAHFKYGGFPWTVAQYVGLAKAYPWAWWASMDLCCEREIAHDDAAVNERVDRTVALLGQCRDEADRQGIGHPMPVLQGWKPDQYRRCADLMTKRADLPKLVGLGSVCRRQLGGPDGLITIVEALDRYLPANVTLHLFGVKGAAIGALAGHRRILSTDSMAWDFACRRERGALPYTVDVRAGWLRRWYAQQLASLRPVLLEAAD